MTATLGDPTIAETEFEEHQLDIVEAFQHLCDSDSVFRDSLVTTTKTIGATSHRIATFGKAVARVLGHPLDIVPRALALADRS